MFADSLWNNRVKNYQTWLKNMDFKVHLLQNGTSSILSGNILPFIRYTTCLYITEKFREMACPT